MDPLQSIVPTRISNQLTDLFRSMVREEVRAELATYRPNVHKALTLPDQPTATQISKALGVTMATVNNWTKDRHQRPPLLVAIEGTARAGRGRRFRKEDVLALIESSKRLQNLQQNPEGETVSAPSTTIQG